MNTLVLKITRSVALALVFAWGVALMGCGGSQAARKSPPQESAAEREAKARAEAERRAREEAERKAREEAERKAKEEAERRAEAERKAREEAEERARKRAFDETIYFDYDRYVVRDDQRPVLNKLVDKLRANPSYRVTVKGHADERGTPEYNLALGQKRAEAIKKLLVTKGKIDPGRVKAISYGETRPADPGHGQVSWSKNRRAAFVIGESSGQMETSGR